MALQSQIEEADRARRGARRADGYSDHLVSLARAEEAAERAERTRAARAVRRIAGDRAPELLDILGLAAPDCVEDAAPVEEVEEVDQVGPVEEVGPRKRCPMCKTHKPHTDFARNPSKRDGCSSYCKPCNKERRKRGRQ